MLEMADGAVIYYTSDFEYDAKAAAKSFAPAGRELCAELAARIGQVELLDHDAIAAIFDGICADRGVKMKDVAQPARFALTGGAPSPGIYEVMAVLGRDETVRRIRRALQLFGC